MAQIDKPNLHFNTKFYTGNSSTNNITGVGFEPSLVWMKNRGAGDSHYLYDAVRGVTKSIYSNLTTAEATKSNGLTAFGTDGFTLGNEGDINGNGNNFVSWNWKANGSGSANTDGSLNSTVSANTTAGFSIVKYTAGGSSAVSTIGHGLNAVPKMIIVKGTDANSTPDQWMVYHEALGNTKRIKLNSTDVPATGSGYWNNTTPTSSLFTVGNSSEGNSANGIYIAYCFAEKAGYSKFGSYTGNGNADGTFIYTGFKPAWVMIKNTQQGADDWQIFDNKRANTFNPADKILQANLSNAEGTSAIDLLSNGFKIRASSGFMNNNGESMIYMCFAEQPLVGSNDIPATAR